MSEGQIKINFGTLGRPANSRIVGHFKSLHNSGQRTRGPKGTQPQEIDNLIILLASYVDEATPSLFCLSTNIFSGVLLSRFVAAAIFGCVSTSSSVKERRERRVNIFFSDFSLSLHRKKMSTDKKKGQRKRLFVSSYLLRFAPAEGGNTAAPPFSLPRFSQ